MPREYRHIQKHEREIIELYEKGLTLRETGEKNWFYIQIQLKTKLTPLEKRCQFVA